MSLLSDLTYDIIDYMAELKMQQQFSADLDEWESLQEQIEEIEKSLFSKRAEPS